MTLKLCRKNYARLILELSAGLTLVFLVAFALNISPYLRGPDEWRWVYAIPGKPLRHIFPLAVLVVYVVSIAHMSRIHALDTVPTGGPHSISKPQRIRALALIAFFIPLIQVALLYPESPNVLRPLFYRTVSAGASGVFSVGSTIENLGTFLREYPRLMPTFPVHPQRYPPGLPVLFYLMRRGFEMFPGLSDALGFTLRRFQCHVPALMRLSNATLATATLQMALPILDGLIVFPLYGLARRMFNQRAAFWTVACYPLIPSFALWAGRWDQAYPPLACTAWYLFWKGLTESRRGYFLSAGLVLSGATLFSFGPVALLAPLGLTTLVWLWAHPERLQWGALILDASTFGLGLALPWLVYQLAFGTGLVDIWRVSMSYHLGLARDYWTWLVFHIYDFFAFLGLPLALGVVISVVTSFSPFLNQELEKKNLGPISPSAALPLGFTLGLLLLNVSGTARGEVARVWLFLTPFAVAIAAYGLSHCVKTRNGMLLIVALLALQLLTFNAFLRVVTTGLTDPPARVHTFTSPPLTHPLNAQLGENITLLGYNLTPEHPSPGDTLHLGLIWQTSIPLIQPYNVFTHLIGPDGQLVTQQDNTPQQGQAPTTCWRPHEIITDTYTLTLPTDAPSGRYTLLTGLYIWNTGERLPTQGAHATPDNSIHLATLQVGTPND